MNTLKGALLASAFLLPTTASADWNGWYAGISAGSVSNSEFEITSGTTGAQADLSDGTSFGGFAGFLNQNGSIVFGAELEIGNLTELEGSDSADPDVLAFEIDSTVFDIKSRIGYDFGNVLAYGVLGISSYSVKNEILTEDFEQTGFNYGVGVDFLLNDNLFIGAEYLSRNPSGTTEIIGTNFEIEHESTVNSLSIRAGFKF